MKRLVFLWNVIFGMIVVYQLYDSIMKYSSRNEIQKNIAAANKDIKEYTEKKNKIIQNTNDLTDENKFERYVRDNLNFKKKGEITYKY
ncbi:hypothetical protein [Leptotrichia sp. oral taxon 847]|uniref:hypothetical protein n=1 Tax=Leptotrichia sp. oral taxon 847 TaxID=1785996 RepID=UPI0007682F65|nr:hypothetical protein [Leptotrichia sp. oral taxon 847]AMD95753.1 hypothetical protein AXF11_09320 [Leptotrichia sp. oral taxon 847]